jgi:8-oxo-dGTP diphosphatase
MGVFGKSETQPIGVCVILQDQQGRVLLGKRKNAFKAGYYGLPGGRIEVGEALETAAKRELIEETGVTVEKLKYVGVVKDFQGERDFIHFIYVARDWQGEITTVEPTKCEGWEWFNRTELPALILIGHQAGLEMLQDNLTIAEVVS